MKKLVLVTISMLGLIIGMPASANNTQKINLVKKLYQQANMRTNSDDIVHKVATVDFQNHLRHAETVIMQTNMMCGHEADLLYANQEPNYKARKTYSVNKQGNVVVKVQGNTIIFVMVNSGKGYKVADILQNGESVKRMIQQTC